MELLVIILVSLFLIVPFVLLTRVGSRLKKMLDSTIIQLKQVILEIKDASDELSHLRDDIAEAEEQIERIKEREAARQSCDRRQGERRQVDRIDYDDSTVKNYRQDDN